MTALSCWDTEGAFPQTAMVLVSVVESCEGAGVSGNLSRGRYAASSIMLS